MNWLISRTFTSTDFFCAFVWKGTGKYEIDLSPAIAFRSTRHKPLADDKI